MIHFKGDRDFAQPPAELWAKLRDARFLVRSVPGSESISEAATNRAVCTVHPGLSFVRGTLEIALEVAEAVEPSLLRLNVHSKGIGSSSDAEVALAFAAREAGTRIHWTADVKTLGGLLKAVPQGLIRGAAQKVIEDLWKGVEARLQSGKGVD